MLYNDFMVEDKMKKSKRLEVAILSALRGARDGFADRFESTEFMAPYDEGFLHGLEDARSIVEEVLFDLLEKKEDVRVDSTAQYKRFSF
jgi:hypothetical protein